MMTYTSSNIAIGEAIHLLGTWGVSHPENDLLKALRDGQLPSWGLVAMTTQPGRSRPPAAWRHLKPVWWHHLNSPMDNSGVLYFEQRSTKPPTPFRAERVEVRRRDIERLWPEPSAASVGCRSDAGQSQASLRGAKSRAILEAIKQIWGAPHEIPQGLSAKDRNNMIIAWIKQNGSSIPSKPERAIQRVLQKLR
jgi:hypothetical protein